jgi:epoxyqueuosine reductase QueG
MKIFSKLSFEKQIKAKALDLGIVHVGITSIDKPKHYDAYVKWTESGYAGGHVVSDRRRKKEKTRRAE